MKKIRFFYYLLFLAVLFAACTTSDSNSGRSDDKSIIEKPEIQPEADRLTPELLWAFGRLSDVQVSPDGSQILFGITYYDLEQDAGNRELYSMPSAGGEMTRLTQTAGSEYHARWRPDGKKIAFLAYTDEGVQLHEMNPDGTGVKQVSQIPDGITGFGYSPDMTHIFYTKEVDLVPDVKDKYPDLDKANARIVEDLMYRHWDSWTDSYSHIFITEYNEGEITEGKDIMEGEEYDSPLKPFGGTEEIAWTPDGKKLAYTCVKKKGVAYTISTNSDIYLYDLESEQTKNLTEGILGYDKAPVFSPDGRTMAWTSMERDGYESDKNRLFVMDLESGEKRDLTADFDQNAHGLSWSKDGRKIYFVSDYHARFQVYEADAAGEGIRALTKGDHNYRSAVDGGDRLIATKQSMLMPTEIFSVSKTDGSETQITQVNTDLLSQLAKPKIEERWIKTTDNKEMLTWVIYPPGFDESKSYPAILYCQGGPQSSVSQFFSYRWNFFLMASYGYVVIAPNRRGLPSFGQEWNEQISGDYGGQNMKDYLSAADALKAEPFIDENRIGAVGASYGGFSVFWLAGNHEGRFKTFIAHDGIFNLEAQYTETEEMWFADWDLGGAYWDKSNETAQRSYANSPHRFVQNWDTPIMVIHGGKDYRIVDSQGMSAFNAAKLRGLEAKLLYFPEENHWVLRPQNSVLWHREFRNWLDKYLKTGQ